MKVALICCGRLENRYAVEFVEHYKQLGFNHIYIIDNNHDGEEHFEDVLQSYIDEQFVTIYNYRNIQCIQCFAYEEVYKLIKNDYDWIFFCDFDEFLILEKDKTIQDYLSRECFKDKNQILVKWKIYTDNDLIYDDGRPNLERFTTESTTDDWTKDLVKSFIRTTFNDIYIDNTIHYFFDKNDILKKTSCDYNGQLVELTLYGIPIGILDNIDNPLAYIKHFATKTIDEWINNKLKRGVGDRSYDDFVKTYNLTNFFKYNNITSQKIKYLINHNINIDNIIKNNEL